MVRGFLNGNGLKKVKNIDFLVGSQDAVNENVEFVGRGEDVEPFLAFTNFPVSITVFNRINPIEE